MDITRTQAFVLSLVSLVAGIGLLVTGYFLSANPTMMGFGGTLVGLFVGGVFFKRPSDIPPSTPVV